MEPDLVESAGPASASADGGESARSDGASVPGPDGASAEAPVAFDRSIRRQVALILAFVVLTVLLLTLAAGGVDAAAHAVTHVFAGPEGCGGG